MFIPYLRVIAIFKKIRNTKELKRLKDSKQSMIFFSFLNKFTTKQQQKSDLKKAALRRRSLKNKRESVYKELAKVTRKMEEFTGKSP